MSWLAANYNGREKSAREEGSAPVPEETERGGGAHQNNAAVGKFCNGSVATVCL